MEPTILDLANVISNNAVILDEHFRRRNLAQPSFSEDAPNHGSFTDPKIAHAQQALISTAWELLHLAIGPVQAVRSLTSDCAPLAALSVIIRFNIFEHVPLGGQVSFEQLAASTGIPLGDIKRILRVAMTSWVFSEPSPNMVAHTASSRELRENFLFQSVIRQNCEEHFGGSAKLADAIEKYPGSEEPRLSGWGLANNADLPLFEELVARYPKRAATFANAMSFFAKLTPTEPVLQQFDWESLGEAKVVDVGGGNGSVSIALARRFPKLSLVVQDLEATIEAGRRTLPEDLRGRLSFMAYDFFTPQPVKDADVYFFRAIFHNWPDKYCIQILQNLISGLKSGARIIIHDPMMPRKGTLPTWLERERMIADMRMLTFYNARDRPCEFKEWESLLAKADSRFRLLKTAGSTMSVVEAVWDP